MKCYIGNIPWCGRSHTLVSLIDFFEVFKYWICWRIQKCPLHMCRLVLLLFYKVKFCFLSKGKDKWGENMLEVKREGRAVSQPRRLATGSQVSSSHSVPRFLAQCTMGSLYFQIIRCICYCRSNKLQKKIIKFHHGDYHLPIDFWL
jgi:hypothetical protein